MGNDLLPLAVSDAGPLIHLAQISKLHLLKKLFKRVLITPEIKREAVDEGVRLGHADALVIRKAIYEGWIVIKDIPKAISLAAKRLAKGENLSLADAETLLSAKEKGAEILVDEKVLSDLAKMYGLKVWNTWTVLLEALRREFIEVSDIESAIIELDEKRHKLKTKQATEIMEAAKLITSRRQERGQRLNHSDPRVRTWNVNLPRATKQAFGAPFTKEGSRDKPKRVGLHSEQEIEGLR